LVAVFGEPIGAARANDRKAATRREGRGSAAVRHAISPVEPGDDAVDVDCDNPPPPHARLMRAWNLLG